jgi:hypothetical protein
LSFVEAQLESIRKKQEHARIEERLQASQVAFKVLPEVELWRAQYTSLRSRFKFLVLDGGSDLGKTRFAYSLSPPPSWRTCCYVDCSSGSADLRSFDSRYHKMLVLDELSPQGAIILKKVLQASNDPCVLGVSPTMQAAYTVVTHGAMIVVTTNVWRQRMSLLDDADREWLATNSVLVVVESKLYEVPAAA